MAWNLELLTQLLAASDSQNTGAEKHSIESELDKEMFLEALRDYKCLLDTSDRVIQKQNDENECLLFKSSLKSSSHSPLRQ